MQITLNVGGVPVITTLERQDQPVGQLQAAVAATLAFQSSLPPDSVQIAVDQTSLVDMTLDSGGTAT